MGKVIKGTKKQFVDLLDAVDRLPTTKAASDIAKHIAFRRALKKGLGSYLDERTELVHQFEVARKEAMAKVQEIDIKLAKATTEEEKTALNDERAALNASVQTVLANVNEKLGSLVEKIAGENVAITFDNEALSFADRLIRESIVNCFGSGDKGETLNNDKVEIVFDLLDSVQNSIPNE